MSILLDYHTALSSRIVVNALKGIDVTRDKQRLDLQNNDPLALRIFQLCNFIEDHNVWQCKKGKITWMMQEPTTDRFGRRVWFSIERSTLQANYAILRDPIWRPGDKRPLDAFDEFLLIIEELDRKYTDVVQKWGKTVPPELNILEPNFCQPNEFDDTCYHWFIDTVFKSITGGAEEDVEHLEKVLLRRWQHPDPFLPGQFINDDGATGKTLFVQQFVYNLFGGLVHTNASMGHVTGKFNEEVAGKAVIYINEAVREKTDMEALKQFMGSPHVRVEAKFERPYLAENRALIICSGNSETGSVSLKGKGADRRFSIYSPSKTIYRWVIEEKKRLEGILITEQQAKTWVETEGQDILSDPVQIGMWLSRVLKKYGEVGPVPELRNDAYNKMLKMQAPAWLDFVAYIFEHPDFVYISKGRLEEMIRHYCKGEILPGPTIMAKRIEDMCVKDKIAVERKTQVYIDTHWEDSGNVGQTRMSVWVKKDHIGSIPYDESLFGEFDANKRWVFTWKH